MGWKVTEYVVWYLDVKTLAFSDSVVVVEIVFGVVAVDFVA